MSIFKRILAMAGEKIGIARCTYVCDCGKEIISSETDATIQCPKCGHPMRAQSCSIEESPASQD